MTIQHPRLRGVLFWLLVLLCSPVHALTVYDEGFALTWSNGSSNATIITENPSGLSISAACGTKTALVEHQIGGEFRPVASGNKNVTSHNVLTFAVQNFTSNGVNPTTNLTAELYDASLQGRGQVSVLAYLPGAMQANQWYTVTIPLVDLNAPTEIRGVGFRAGGHLVYAWDCVKILYDEAYDPSRLYTDAISTYGKAGRGIPHFRTRRRKHTRVRTGLR